MKLHRPLALALSVCALAACGGSENNGNDTTSPSAAPASTPSPSAPSSSPDSSSSPAPSPAPSPSPATTNHSGSCVFVTGGSTAVTSTTESGCTSCSVSDAKKAADGDAATAATVSQSQATPTAGIALRVTAQQGIVFAAGSRAGARLTLPGSTGPGQTSGLALRTYLGGALQETHTVVTPQTCGGACNTGAVASAQNFKTTKTFDAVEVYVYGGTTAAEVATKVSEFCSDD